MTENPKQSKQNRTIVVDFKDTEMYNRLCLDGQAFLELVIAFIMSIGFQLKHKPNCPGGFALTRHSHYLRVRIGGLTIWRIQCTRCKAVFTVLPPFVLRYRKMKTDIAEKALLVTHHGLSLEVCAMLLEVSPMAIYRLICAAGTMQLVTVLTRCRLPLPRYFLADEKHSHCLETKVYLPTIVTGRVIWHLGYTEDKSAEAFEASYQQFQQAALAVDPSYRPRGILTDSFESTIQSLRTLFPTAALANCLLHAANKIPSKLKAGSSSLRKTLSHEFYQLFKERSIPRLLPVFSLGKKLRRFVETVKKTAGPVHAEQLGQWIGEKKAGWYALFSDPNIPATSTWLDQAHNTLDRKLFMMKGFHHPQGSQRKFLTGLAVLYNLIPYQRRAQHAGRCGIEVEGGTLPTHNWFLNFQILTSGGFQ